MNEQIVRILAHMAKAHEELARILMSARDITRHTSDELVGTLSTHEHEPSFRDREDCLRHTMQLTGSVSSFLSGIGDLQEALADNLEPVMEQMQSAEEE